MNIDLVVGRNFSSEMPGDTAAALVNESLVKSFGLRDPIGDKIRLGGKGNPKFFFIIGVVKDFHQSPLYSSIAPQVFLTGKSSHLFIKMSGNIAAALRYVEDSWSKIIPNVHFGFKFMEDQVQDGYRGDQVRGKVFLLLSVLTVFIAFLGLFGLASFLASQRRREMSIRKVMGATWMNSIVLMTREFVLIVLVAAIPASLVSWYVVREWLGNFVYQTEIRPGVFVFALLVTVVLTFIATGIHAVRTSFTNPLNNLRQE